VRFEITVFLKASRIISINRGKAPERHSKSQICRFDNERVE
jgi:hypothetical protein